jgi:fructan beta-fructosidase
MPTEPIRCKRAQVSFGLFLIAAIFFAQQVFCQQPAASSQASGLMSGQVSGQESVSGTAWQPQIHFYAPPNWINDPNGPILLNGQYHLFFQLNPLGDEWGHMSWGHAVSSDLAHWKQLPVAIPEENGVAIFSGSTVVDQDNTSGLCGDAGQKTPGCLVAIYTGASKDKQDQNIAVSRDGGATWTKYASNPVIDLGLKDFRDPKVFWHAPSQSWVMVVSLADQHKIRIYRSKNLRQWELASDFGPAGAISGVWECPDLVELPVLDDAGKRVYDTVTRHFVSRWLLSVNINPGGPAKGSADQYFIGQFDGFRFTEDHPGSAPRWVDWGKDFYASTSFSNIPSSPDANPDRIWIAWMGDWQYASKLPSLPGRGEMTMARRIFFRQASALHGLTSSQAPLLLVQKPILPIPADKRYAAMFGGPRFQPIPQANAQLAAQKPVGNVYRLRFTFDAGEAAESGVRLRRSTANPDSPAVEETVVGIDQAKGTVFVDRTRSGETDWSPDFPVRVSAPLKHPQAGTIAMEIVVDNNSIEVFAEDGETVLTDLIYPAASSQGIAFYSTPTPPGSGPVRVRDLELIPLAPPAAK